MQRLTLDFVKFVISPKYPLPLAHIRTSRLAGSHTGERMAHAVHESLEKFGIADRVCTPLHVLRH